METFAERRVRNRRPGWPYRSRLTGDRPEQRIRELADHHVNNVAAEIKAVAGLLSSLAETVIQQLGEDPTKPQVFATQRWGISVIRTGEFQRSSTTTSAGTLVVSPDSSWVGRSGGVWGVSGGW